MTSVNLPAEFKIISKKLFKKKPEKVLEELRVNELKRELIEYRLVDEQLKREYAMNFDDFKKKEEG